VAQKILSHHPDFKDDKLSIDNKHINLAGFGIELCRVVRNKLAHGLTSPPEPEEWQWRPEISDKWRVAFLNLVSRLALMTMQMMLAAHLGSKFQLNEPINLDVYGESSFIDVLLNLQIESDEIAA
jgi:hypothetical protein